MAAISGRSQGNWPTVFDAATCVRKGLCPVMAVRGQETGLTESHSLYFEQHGSGSNKVVLIMGLNSSSFSWGDQVELLAKNNSVLVFDNRGVGNSTTPRGPYSTSGMAEDVIALLDFVGWRTGKRDLHIVGTSLGGMIAMELSTRMTSEILSLTLSVTTPGAGLLYNFPPWKGVKTLARLFLLSSPADKIPLILDMLFPREWLESPSEGDAAQTNRGEQTRHYLRRLEITRPQTIIGHFSQMIAGLTHYVSPPRLRSISSGIPMVTILTGDSDNLIRPSNSRVLKQHMPEAELRVWEDTGHAMHIQWPKRYCNLLKETFEEGKRRHNKTSTL